MIVAAAAAAPAVDAVSFVTDRGREGGERDSGESREVGGGGDGCAAAWWRGGLANAFERKGCFGVGALAASATMRGVSSRGVGRPMEGGGGGGRLWFWLWLWWGRLYVKDVHLSCWQGGRCGLPNLELNLSWKEGELWKGVWKGSGHCPH